MDHGTNIHYIAMMLDPQLKFEMLKEELEDEDAANVIKEQIRTYLHSRYSAPLAMSQYSHHHSPLT